MCVSVCAYAHVCVHVCVHVRVCVHVCTCVCVHVHAETDSFCPAGCLTRLQGRGGAGSSELCRAGLRPREALELQLELDSCVDVDLPSASGDRSLCS